MEIKKRNNKGITLIALVITIIVLLILAGVSISMLTGDSGILTQANKSIKEDKRGQYEDVIKLYKNYAEINEVSNYEEGNKIQVIKNNLEKEEIFKDSSIELINNEKIYIETKENFCYEITEDNFKRINNVKCIINTGSEYIDSKELPTENMKIEATVSFPTTTKDMLVMGAYGFSIYSGNSNTGLYAKYKSANPKLQSVIKPNEIQNIEVSNNNIKIDDNNYSYTVPEDDFSFWTYPIYIFASSHRETPSSMSQPGLKIYKIKIYDNDELKRYLIPAFDNQKQISMYDVVNGEYLYNMGSGEFLYEIYD